MIVGVVPAAGYARRLQPLSTSKEVLPVGGRPVMEHLIDRMVLGGAQTVAVVTRRDKSDVVYVAERRGARVVYAEPASVADSILGGVDGLADDDTVLVGFPDTLWEPADGFARMVERLRPDGVVLGLFTTDELSRSDVVVVAPDDTIEGIMVKPKDPPSQWIWGCAAASAKVLRGLAGYTEPGHYFHSLCASGRVSGVRLSGPFIDVGTKEALVAARATTS